MRIDGLAEDVVRLELARRQFRRFVATTKPDYQFNWHHDVLCHELELFARGDTTHLMVFMPPRHGKSELVSRRLPAYLLGRNPDLQIIGASYGDSLAARMNRDVQRIIDSPTYQRIFPETRLWGENVRTVAHGSYLRNADMFEIVDYSGSYRSAGIGSGLTGMGANVAIIDDPIKDQKEADSITQRNTVWEWYGSVLETRLEKDAKVLLTLTRWHEDDLAGRILALGKSDPGAQQWRVVCFPGLKEGEPTELDPRLEGEALWAAKYTPEVLAKRKKTLGTRRFAALFQQAPTPAEGAVIKRAWCNKFWRELPGRLDEQIISIDCTFKDTAKADFVVMDCWARHGADRYLIDQVRDRMDLPATLIALQAFCAKHPKAFVKVVEDKANGPAVISTLKRKVPGLIAFNPQGSKDERLSAVAPEFEAGNVYLPHWDRAPWVHDWIEEVCTNAANDDRKDACSQALLRFRGTTGSDFPDPETKSTVRNISGIKKDEVQW